jgi:hypothetical protein
VRRSTDHIKQGSLILSSTAQIKSSEGVYQLLISAVRARLDGGAVGSDRGRPGLVLTAVRRGRAWRLIGVQVFSSHGGQFLMRFAPTGS